MIVVGAVTVWFGVGMFAVGCLMIAKWLVRDRSLARMQRCARTIDDGGRCTECGGHWVLVDETVSMNGPEVRTRQRFEMDHADSCRYAEWAGL